VKKFFVYFAVVAVVFILSCNPQPVHVKNVIVMVADGASLSSITAARWYKAYNGMGDYLHVDPHLCGTVSSFGSKSLIPDSAPTMSCYMTGVPSEDGNISIYPRADAENDLIPLDPSRANQPLATLMEAARIQQGKSIGIAVTCEFTHATPASCAAHHYSRGNYKALAPQMAFNNIDVLIGGGTSLVSDDMKAHFRNSGTALIEDDLTAMRRFNGDKMWALYGSMAMPYDLDRDPEKVPSLEEMTRKAIELLSKNKKGFFLMVEGSKIDWAAHSNDAAGIITELIAFDNAVGAALEFARKCGNTAIVVLADHGTGGPSIGRNGWQGGTTMKALFDAVSQFKKTAPGMVEILNATPPDRVKSEFARHTSIDLDDQELESILNSRDYKMNENPQASASTLQSNIVRIMNRRTPFGFTTGGHTGEEVFLAVYHPSNYRPTGFTTNIQINEYLQRIMKLPTSLTELSDKLFAKHGDALAGLNYEIIAPEDDFPTLTATKGNNALEIKAFSSVAYVNGNPVDLGSVAVYIDRNQTFYLPADVVKITGL